MDHRARERFVTFGRRVHFDRVTRHVAGRPGVEPAAARCGRGRCYGVGMEMPGGWGAKEALVPGRGVRGRLWRTVGLAALPQIGTWRPDGSCGLDVRTNRAESQGLPSRRSPPSAMAR